MRIIFLITLTFLVEIVFGQDTLSIQCTCKKSVKEFNYIEKKHNSGIGVFSHEGDVLINDEVRQLYTKVNKHFFYLNNCAGKHAVIVEGYTYCVIQKDIDIWKEYLILNCSEVFKKYYRPSKKINRSYDYDVEVKIKNR